MITEHGSLVRIAGVRIVAVESFGVFCVVSDNAPDLFIPFALIYDPPASRLLPGKIVELAVPDWFASEHDLPIAAAVNGGQERGAKRDEPRPIDAVSSIPAEQRGEVRGVTERGRYESLWLFCTERAVGGQAMMRDISMCGMGVVVNRGAWRLVAALRETQQKRTLVELSRIPYDRHRRARVIWIGKDDLGEIRVGLQFDEPLSGSAG